MMLRRAVFLDRDGTINVEKNYLIDPAEFEFIPGAPQALKRLQRAGFLLVVVTNQAGVARGYFGVEDVHLLHDYMRSKLLEYGVKLDGVYLCPHHPTEGFGDLKKGCTCRKGQPGMLLQAADELGIDLRKSYMIGDKEADIAAGDAAGCQTLLVKTGYGCKWFEKAERAGVRVAENLPEAVESILSDNSL